MELSRCYSMSSAPETDAELVVTVKRVPGGAVSNWLVDHVAEGDILEVTRPSGTFCVRDRARPIVAFCGGSGITPVMSITRSVLATSSRPVRLFYANRAPGSVIFEEPLAALGRDHPGRLEVRHHLDSVHGLVDEAEVLDFVGGRLDADFYLCGPAPFMDLVASVLQRAGVAPGDVAVERFAGARPLRRLRGARRPRGARGPRGAPGRPTPWRARWS